MTLSARVALAIAAGQSPEAAARGALATLAARVGTEAGLIAVAPDGRLGLARTAASMPWAAVRDGVLESGDYGSCSSNVLCLGSSPSPST